MRQTQNIIRREEMDLSHLRSVNAVQEANSRSNRYAFVPTTKVIDLLRSEGWIPTDASETRIRTADRMGFQSHMVRFQQREAVPIVDDIVPEVVIKNAHDGTSWFEAMFGLFKFVCSNGLVVSEASFGVIKIKHVGFTIDQVLRAVSEILKTIPAITEKVVQFRNLMLNPEEQRIFAQAALLMRANQSEGFGTYENGRDSYFNMEDRRYNTTRLLEPKRREDTEPNLWNTYNVVQEKFVNGDKFEDTTKKSETTGKTIHRTKTKKIVSIDENIRVNQGLWHLTEEMAKLKKDGSAAEQLF